MCIRDRMYGTALPGVDGSGMTLATDNGKRFFTILGAVMASYRLNGSAKYNGTGTPLVPGGKADVLALVADVNVTSGTVVEINGGAKLELTQPFTGTFDASFTMDQAGWGVGLGVVGPQLAGISNLQLAYTTSTRDVTVGTTVFKGVTEFGVAGVIDLLKLCSEIPDSFLVPTKADAVPAGCRVAVKNHVAYNVPVQANLADTLTGWNVDLKVWLDDLKPELDAMGSAGDYGSDYVSMTEPFAHIHYQYTQGSTWTSEEFGVGVDVNWRVAGGDAIKPGRTYTFGGDLNIMTRPGFKGLALNARIANLTDLFGVAGLELRDNLFTLQLGTGSSGAQAAVGVAGSLYLPDAMTRAVGLGNVPLAAAVVVGRTSCVSAGMGTKDDTSASLLDLGPITVSAFSFMVVSGPGSCQVGNTLMAKTGFAISGRVLGVPVAGSLYWKDSVDPATEAISRGVDLSIDVGKFDLGAISFDESKLFYSKDETASAAGGLSYEQAFSVSGGVHIGDVALTGSVAMDFCASAKLNAAKARKAQTNTAVTPNPVATDTGVACSVQSFSANWDLEAKNVGFPGFMINDLHLQGVQQSGGSWHQAPINSMRMYANGDINVLGSTVKFNGGYDVVAHIPIRVWGNAEVDLEIPDANSHITGTVGFGLETFRPQDTYLYIGGEPICVQPQKVFGDLDYWLGMGGTTPEAQCQGGVISAMTPPVQRLCRTWPRAPRSGPRCPR